MLLIRHLPGEGSDRFGQQVSVIRHLDALWDLWLREATGMNDRLFVLNLLPLEALLAAVSVETFAVLPGRIEEAPRHLSTHIRVANFERGRLDGKRAAVLLRQLLVDAPRTVA